MTPDPTRMAREARDARRLQIAGLLLVLYLSIGVIFGSLIGMAIPAVNLRGVLYFAVTWPAQLKGSPVRVPIPYWCFSSPEATHG